MYEQYNRPIIPVLFLLLSFFFFFFFLIFVSVNRLALKPPAVSMPRVLPSTSIVIGETVSVRKRSRQVLQPTDEDVAPTPPVHPLDRGLDSRQAGYHPGIG